MQVMHNYEEEYKSMSFFTALLAIEIVHVQNLYSIKVLHFVTVIDSYSTTVPSQLGTQFRLELTSSLSVGLLV